MLSVCSDTANGAAAVARVWQRERWASIATKVRRDWDYCTRSKIFTDWGNRLAIERDRLQFVFEWSQCWSVKF